MNIKKSCENCDYFTKGADESYCNFSWSDVKCENFNKWELKHLLDGDIYQPQLDNCKWLFEFNTEVATAILNYSKVLSHLLQRIEILESKLNERILERGNKHRVVTEGIISLLPPVTPKPKTDVLDKIRAEIADLDDANYDYEGYYKAVTDALKIIDKYKAESEDKG